MTLSAIVAVSENGVIGKENGLPWYLPAELANFKKITMGQPIIMGRKTHESIGRALPGRLNIVITRNEAYEAAEGCKVVNSLDEAIKAAEGADEAFVIGGATIYEQAMPRLDRLYLTRVKAVIDGDKYFQFDPSQWKQVSKKQYKADEKNKYDYEFMILERI
jgi:dihydrofolate reductase